jgi:hypothetical protein
MESERSSRNWDSGRVSPREYHQLARYSGNLDRRYRLAFLVTRRFRKSFLEPLGLMIKNKYDSAPQRIFDLAKGGYLD